LQRKIKEVPEMVVTTDGKRCLEGSAVKNRIDQKDPELTHLHEQLKSLEVKYGKTHEEIAEIYCKVSGQLDKIKDYLEQKPVIEWTFLEDLALTKPDDSPEFQVLLQSKGWEEIMIRREFLHATPVVNECDK
jgi:predicted nuclease with TOPRIM domain